MPELNKKQLKTILDFQQAEVTEAMVYEKLAGLAKTKKNRNILLHIAEDEKKHYETWRSYTKVNLKPKKIQVNTYYFLAKVLGLTFTVKLMEKMESEIQDDYQSIMNVFPETKQIFDEEHAHEQALIGILQEERLSYLGSVVLGLSDALVELTGALAGLSFALQNTKLIALAGLVTGIAASMSMAGSEYLSKKTEKDSHPLKAATATGVAYIFTVLFLVTPFLILKSYQQALAISMVTAVIIIAGFTFFNAVVQDLSFKKKFFEMSLITFGVAAISFGIGILLRNFLGFNI